MVLVETYVSAGFAAGVVDPPPALDFIGMTFVNPESLLQEISELRAANAKSELRNSLYLIIVIKWLVKNNVLTNAKIPGNREKPLLNDY